jgi:cyclopropane-fatty-acyl-phospholipid synthase
MIMRSSEAIISEQLITNDKSRWLDRLARKAVHNHLRQLQKGEIVLREGKIEYYFGQKTRDCKLCVTIDVLDFRFYSDIAFAGSVGAGEGYMQGFWTCSDLTALVRLLLINRHVLDNMDQSLSRLKAPLHKLLHWFNRNTRQGSRRNIEAHYDLGNELFEQFLDPLLMYSAAYYKSPSMSLEQAAIAKLDRICLKLELSPEDHVLEIGTGWGGFAIHAAQHYGCQVTTTTISKQQYELACKRVKQAGLEDRITVFLDDYRDLQGRFDKLVSIEMIEAIGHQYLPTYFSQCSHLLKPNGMMLLQAITIADQQYEAALRDVDFIKRYIFPGGFLPSIAVMTNSITKATDMKLFHMEDIGPHYATTLRDWRQRFFHNIEQIKALGYSDIFTRMWDFYLCYCQGAFKERAIGTVQMLLVKPGCQRAPVQLPD